MREINSVFMETFFDPRGLQITNWQNLALKIVAARLLVLGSYCWLFEELPRSDAPSENLVLVELADWTLSKKVFSSPIVNVGSQAGVHA